MQPCHFLILMAGFAMGALSTHGQSAQPSKPAEHLAATSAPSALLAVSGKVEVSKFGSTEWSLATLNQTLSVGDKVRTGAGSRAAIRLPNLSVLRMNERTTVEIQKPTTTVSKATLSIQVGAAYFFGRGQPGEINVRTPMATSAIRGTEFNVQVDSNGATVFTVIEGGMDVANDLGSVPLKPGQQASVVHGAAPQVSPFLQLNNIIQWSLYYPGVIDTSELEFNPEETTLLSASLTAYREGDLAGALARLPSLVGRSDSSGIYEAALLLSVGQVGQAQSRLGDVKLKTARSYELIDALTTLIATVKNQAVPNTNESASVSASPSLLMARSYWLQSRFKLEQAFTLAMEATKISPNFGFAWERLAELHFSFGRVDEARQAMEKALELSPKNAQALALRGFLLSAENRIVRAQEAFEQAIALDPNLGNAWLGLGPLPHPPRRRQGRPRGPSDGCRAGT